MTILSKIKNYLKTIKTKPYNIFNTKYLSNKMIEKVFESDYMNLYIINHSLYIRCGKTTLKVVRGSRQSLESLIVSIFNYIEKPINDYIIFPASFVFMEGELNQAFKNAIRKYQLTTKMDNKFVRYLAKKQFEFEDRIKKYEGFYRDQFLAMLEKEEQYHVQQIIEIKRIYDEFKVNRSNIQQKCEKLKSLSIDERIRRLNKEKEND